MRGRTRRLAILALREVLETPTDAKSAPAKLSAARQVRASYFHVSQPSPDRELMAEEERLWTELHRLVDSLPEDEMEEPG